MLVLSRKEHERVVLFGDGGVPLLVITIIDIDRNRMRIGLSARRSHSIVRGELLTADEIDQILAILNSKTEPATEAHEAQTSQAL